MAPSEVAPDQPPAPRRPTAMQRSSASDGHRPTVQPLAKRHTKLLTTGPTIPPAASARGPDQQNHSARVEGSDHMSQLVIIKHNEFQYMLRGPVGRSVESSLHRKPGLIPPTQYQKVVRFTRYSVTLPPCEAEGIQPQQTPLSKSNFDTEPW